MKARYLCSTVLCAVVAGQMPALAQDTVTYSYDALGRLSGTSVSGGPTNGTATTTCFDRAGNRTRYDVTLPAPAPAPGPCPTPSPTATP